VVAGVSQCVDAGASTNRIPTEYSKALQSTDDPQQQGQVWLPEEEQALDFHDGQRGRLIEHYFPADAWSGEGAAERYSSGKTAHTIFTWWARRPFVAMRGVIATSLLRVDGANQDSVAGVLEYCTGPTNPLVRQIGKDAIGPDPQRVLDVFAGGATIPIEAAAIGAHAYALENNELAHFIQLSLLQLSQTQGNLSELVRHHGRSLLTQLKEATVDFFPQRRGGDSSDTIAYYWSRSINCPSCNARLSLQKRPWLSKKKTNKREKSIFIQRTPNHEHREYSRTIMTHGEPDGNMSNAWQGKTIECPFCHHIIVREKVSSTLARFGYDELTAYCTSPGAGRGKEFFVAENPAQLVPSDAWLTDQINADLAAIGKSLPANELPRWSGIVNPSLYGICTFSDLFHRRQLAILIKCCRLLRDEFRRCREAHGTECAEAVVAFLSGLVDQLVDWNGRICTWIPENEQVGRGYSGPGIPMVWDFVEIDPLQNGPANLWDKLDRIVDGLQSIPIFNHLPVVVKGDARQLPFQDAFFDVVATDPPYFDNLYYNVLADCIYIWKRLALSDIFPAVFAPTATNEEHELSVSKYRHGSLEDASRYYTDGMTMALTEIRRVLKQDGVLAFIFAHSSLDGWASIVEAFLRARLEMVAAWSMHIERKHRPRGMNSDAVNTSFVLIGKKYEGERDSVQWSDFASTLRSRLLEEQQRLLVSSTLNACDITLSLLGVAMSLCTRVNHVYDDGRTIHLRETMERVVDLVEVISPGFSIARR